MKVRIIPITQRAKNRVAEHGEVFKLVMDKHFNGKPGVLCSSLSGTWLGWFDEDEATWEIVEE